MEQEKEKKLKVDTPFVPIETSLFANKNLTNTDRVIYGWIWLLSTNEDNHCFAHSDYLCKIVGIKERQLRYCLAKLKKYNYIKISYVGKQRYIKPYIIDFMEKREEINNNIDDFEKNELFDYNWLEED